MQSAGYSKTPSSEGSSSSHEGAKDRLFTISSFADFYQGFNWDSVEDCRDAETKEFQINKALTDKEFYYLKAKYLMIMYQVIEDFYLQYHNAHDPEFFDLALSLLASKGSYSKDLVRKIIEKNSDTDISKLMNLFIDKSPNDKVLVPAILSLHRIIEKSINYFENCRMTIRGNLKDLGDQIKIIDETLEEFKGDSIDAENLQQRRFFILDAVELLWSFYKFYEANKSALSFLLSFYKLINLSLEVDFEEVAIKFPDLTGGENEDAQKLAEKKAILAGNKEYTQQIGTVYIWRVHQSIFSSLSGELKVFFEASQMALVKNAAAAHLKAALALNDPIFNDLKTQLLDEAKRLNSISDAVNKEEVKHQNDIKFSSHLGVIDRMTNAVWKMKTQSYHYDLRATFLMNRVITSPKMPSAEKDKYEKEFKDIVLFYQDVLNDLKANKVLLFPRQYDTKKFVEHCLSALNAAATFGFSRFITEYKKDKAKQFEICTNILGVLTLLREYLNVFTLKKLKPNVSWTHEILNGESYAKHQIPNVNKHPCVQSAVRVEYPNGIKKIISRSSMDDDILGLIHIVQNHLLMLEVDSYDKLIQADYLASESKKREELAAKLIAEEELEKTAKSSEIEKYFTKVQSNRRERIIKSARADKQVTSSDYEQVSTSTSSDFPQQIVLESNNQEEDQLWKIYHEAGEALMQPNFEIHAAEAYDELFRRASLDERPLMKAMALNGKAEVLFRASSVLLAKFSHNDFVDQINKCKSLSHQAVDILKNIDLKSLPKNEVEIFAKFSNAMEMNLFEIEQTIAFIKFKFNEWKRKEDQKYEEFKASELYKKGNPSNPSPRAKMRKIIEGCTESINSLNAQEFTRDKNALSILNTQMLPLGQNYGVDFNSIRNQALGQWSSTTAMPAFVGVSTNPYALEAEISSTANDLLKAIKQGVVQSKGQYERG